MAQKNVPQIPYLLSASGYGPATLANLAAPKATELSSQLETGFAPSRPAAPRKREELGGPLWICWRWYFSGGVGNLYPYGSCRVAFSRPFLARFWETLQGTNPRSTKTQWRPDEPFWRWWHPAWCYEVRRGACIDGLDGASMACGGQRMRRRERRGTYVSA